MKFTVTLADNILRKNMRIQEITWDDIKKMVNNPPKANKNKIYNPAILGGVCEWETENSIYKKGTEKIINRQLLILDCEHITNNNYFTERTYELLQLMYKVAYVRYTTMSCTEMDRRYRIIIPLSRTVNGEEYSVIARAIMMDIGENYFDPVSERITQWMFLPAEKFDLGCLYMGQCFDGDALNVDAMLDMIENSKEFYDSYSPYKKETEKVETEAELVELSDLPMSEVGDPRTKMSIVGSFCKAYSVSEAIEEFELPYTMVTHNLYMYDDSVSRNAGAKVINNDLLMISYHSTDKIYEYLKDIKYKQPTNAFDLVLAHKYKGNFKAMEQDILKDPLVMKYETKRRRQFLIMKRLRWYDEKGFNIKSFKLNDGSFVTEEEANEVRKLYLTA